MRIAVVCATLLGMSWTCSAASNALLVANLQQAGIIRTASVAAAMKAVDRGCFCKSNPYRDSPQPIGHGVTISAPHMHAYALEYLAQHLRPGARALDVGAGSGYLTVAMAHMVGPSGSAHGIEHIEALVRGAEQDTRAHFPDMLDRGQVAFHVVDGFEGLPEHGPYDVIHVGAAAPAVPAALLEQLRAGGRMFIPVGPEDGDQHIVVVDKDGEGRPTERRVMGVRYVPLTSKARQEARARGR